MSLLVEINEGDLLLLSVIEAYFVTGTKSNSAVTGSNTLITKARQ